MKKIFSVVTLLVAASAVASQGTQVDLAASQLKWKGTKVTGEHSGMVPLKSAKVELEKGQLKSGEFVADLAGFTVTDLQGEMAAKLTGHLKSADFFEVEKYPEAKLVLKAVKGSTFEGDLTIKGKAAPVKVDFKQEGKKYSGVMTFDRTKHGLVYGSSNFFKNLGDKAISNDVTVDFNVVLK